MKSFLCLPLTGMVLLGCLSIATAQRHPQKTSPTSVQPFRLQCDYLETPLGVDNPNPRLGWQLKNNGSGVQVLPVTAFQVITGTDSLAVCHDRGDAWISGKMNTSAQLVRYAGKPLIPFTRYYWKIIAWNQGKKAGEAVSSFETGMLSSSNWHGDWISDNENREMRPAALFRKDFQLGKKIKSARAYIAVAGLYELYFNGHRIGNRDLDPAYTRFDRRTEYITYDITDALLSGKNTVGVMLGNGWYNLQSTAVWDFDKAPWRNRPAFCLDIRITYTDGSSTVIGSDKSWKTATGPVIFNSIYTAEHFDARKKIPDWNTPVFNDSAWRNVILRSAPSAHIVSEQMRPIVKTEKIIPVAFHKINDTAYVYDLGRNISGISQITVSGDSGTVLRLKHGELLDSNGRVDLSNIDVHYRPHDDRDPFQTDIYILSGENREVFSPHFNYKGFQYVEVTATKPLNLTKESLCGYFMHSDVPAAGSINSSDTVLNKIWAATNNAYLSNLFGYPTDCPQREKNGWTGDAQINVETGLYNFDAITVYEKWMRDHQDEQQPNGTLPSIIPSNGWGYEWGNGPDWTSTIAIIPWNIYLFYGDTTILSACYGNIKRYVDRITATSKDHLTSWGLGDWVPVKSKTPVEFTSSAYYYADALILAKTAQLKGLKEDSKKYFALAADIRNAFNRKYLDAQKGIYADGNQTEMSAALYWGLVPDSLKATVAANLSKRVANDGWHIDVGLLGTKTILNALSENGYADAAYRLAAQRTYPSWGWWIVNGATSLLENWNIHASSDISHNHIMFGEIGAWLYKGIAGIFPDEKAPGFKHVLLKPHFVDGLDHFEASHESPYGTIRVSWKKSDNGIDLLVNIPPNTTASLYLPAGYPHIKQDGKNIPQTPVKLGAGTFEFRLEK